MYTDASQRQVRHQVEAPESFSKVAHQGGFLMTQWFSKLNLYGKMSHVKTYHVISYHIISYHIISYHIIRTPLNRFFRIRNYIYDIKHVWNVSKCVNFWMKLHEMGIFGKGRIKSHVSCCASGFIGLSILTVHCKFSILAFWHNFF